LLRKPGRAKVRVRDGQPWKLESVERARKRGFENLDRRWSEAAVGAALDDHVVLAYYSRLSPECDI
jgi:hypothetical protein